MSSSSENQLLSLLPSGTSGIDFLQTLLHHFGSASGSVDSHEMLYPSNPPHLLRIAFNKRGEPIEAIKLESMTNDQLQALRNRIQCELVDSTGVSVNRQVYFSRGPVLGWWRYRDQFQIIPVPAIAPKPDFAFLNHPFLIEFRYKRASEFVLDGCRRMRNAFRISLILNALLVNPIHTLGRRPLGSIGFAWVLMPAENEPGDQKIAYRQESYHYKGMHDPSEDFSDVGNLDKIREVSPADYYQLGQVGQHVLVNDLQVPSDLSDTLDRFYALDPNSQSRFLNSCYWLSQAYSSFSSSMQFLAAVQAIETLTDRATGGVTCDHCGFTKKPGPTQQFAQFLDRHVPSAEWGEKGGRLLYEVRSGLTHGYLPPFLSDTENFAVLNPTSMGQEAQIALALTTARIALRSWLLEADS